MDRLFLDANILFSVAYKENTGISKLWVLKNIKLIASEYTFEKAKRNLSNLTQLHRLETFSQKIEVHTKYNCEALLPPEINLKEKDRSIFAAAIVAKADYLITGDFQAFGRFYGKRIANVMVLPASTYLRNYQS